MTMNRRTAALAAALLAVSVGALAAPAQAAPWGWWTAAGWWGGWGHSYCGGPYAPAYCGDAPAYFGYRLAPRFVRYGYPIRPYRAYR